MNDRYESSGGSRSLLGLIAGGAVLLAAFVILFQVVFGISRVDGDSMMNTLRNGQTVFFLRTVKDYEIGDVVAVKAASGETYVKRIVAREGDVVDIREGKFYINDIPENDFYARGMTWEMRGGVEFPYTVGEGKFFLLGDNRERSEDSRVFGALPLRSLQGRLYVD